MGKRGWKPLEPAGRMPSLHDVPARAGCELPEAVLSAYTCLMLFDSTIGSNFCRGSLGEIMNAK